MSTVVKKSPLSVLLEQKNKMFLQESVKTSSQTKTDIVNKALDLYRKYMLRKQIEEGFKAQTDEDLQLAMSDFEDYYSLVNEEECN